VRKFGFFVIMAVALGVLKGGCAPMVITGKAHVEQGLPPSPRVDSVRIGVLISEDIEPYREALAGFTSILKARGMRAEFDICTMGAKDREEKCRKKMKSAGHDLLFTIGTPATVSAVRGTAGIPIVAGLVLRDDALRKAKNATGVVLDFPPETQLKALRRFLPEARRVGVLYNPDENGTLIASASRVAQKMGLRLTAVKVSGPQDLPLALEALADSADVLWGVPDAVVLNPKTAKNILLFSYRHRIPFIGPSESWVKEGALYALDRDYRDMGAQCGEMALRVLEGARPETIAPVGPRKVIYSLNLKAARHMKVSFPQAAVSAAHRIYREDE